MVACTRADRIVPRAAAAQIRDAARDDACMRALPFMRAAQSSATRSPKDGNSPSDDISVLGARGYRLLAFTSAVLHVGSTAAAALSLGIATSAPMDVGSRLWELLGLLRAAFNRNVCVQPQSDDL